MAKSTRPLGPHDNISSNDNVVLRLGTLRKEVILIYYGWSTNPTPNEQPRNSWPYDQGLWKSIGFPQ